MNITEKLKSLLGLVNAVENIFSMRSRDARNAGL